MTLPIVPGPFSFLAQLGEAGGEAFKAHEKDRQRQLKEARDNLDQMLNLRSAGLLQPEAFHSPEAMSIYKTLGIAPEGIDQPTVGEQKTNIQKQYLQPEHEGFNLPISSIIRGAQDVAVPAGGPSTISDERRAFAGLPERGVTQGVNARIAQSTAAVPVAQVAGASATAELPEAGTTALAGQVSQQGKTFDDVADNIVQGLFAEGGSKKLPTVDEAITRGQTDAQARQFGPKIGKSIYGRAIEKLRQKLEADKTARIGAEARYSGQGATALVGLAKVYQDQVDTDTSQLKSLASEYGINPMLDETMYAQFQADSAAGKTSKNPFGAAKAAKYKEYVAKRKTIQDRIDRTQTKLNAILEPKLGIPGDKTQQQRWDEAAAHMKTDPKYTGKTPESVLGPRP